MKIPHKEILYKKYDLWALGLKDTDKDFAICVVTPEGEQSDLVEIARQAEKEYNSEKVTLANIRNVELMGQIEAHQIPAMIEKCGEDFG